ncbi:hypothetical protein BBO01nite_03340 [Brevibacillus borstelensis]|nr:hypothetical protein BBO01nite_03340 [Brevibacillus borstelensis]
MAYPVQGPSSPPPGTIPPKPAVSYIVDCLYAFTFVWLINGIGFGFIQRE